MNEASAKLSQSRAYIEDFRKDLKMIVLKYLQLYPRLKETSPEQYKKACQVADYADNRKITPMYAWKAASIIEEGLSESFFSFIFPNYLKRGLKMVLNKYPKNMLKLHFDQDQYAESLQTGRIHVAEVRELRERSTALESKVSVLTKRVQELTDENEKLKDSNSKLQSDNLALKTTLDKVLSASDMSKEKAAQIRQELDQEIERLRKREEEAKEKMSEIVSDKNVLFERCHTLESINTEYESKNKRLSEINSTLLKEKMDLERLLKQYQEKERRHSSGSYSSGSHSGSGGQRNSESEGSARFFKL